MTPFMLCVAEILGRDPRAGELPVPGTRPSEPASAGAGADRQVAVRALAEQLVCEANAVLTQADDHLALTDELSVGELAFSVHYRGRTARVSTRFADGTAYGRLVGDGLTDTGPRELDGPGALTGLLLRLLAESDVPRRPATL
ncbi:hypothetical protein [Streptomyces sp. GC420]|uniref:hypothetical protein n=1 Tax=Streptomyces sp. GC420 TaxID=2697568 RepID=UPI0014152F32|nr:hypothetical protein [Streptomyces sp. GC420]NBM16143.1 hypothetical protein [Streptomyces sp. GC420]